MPTKKTHSVAFLDAEELHRDPPEVALALTARVLGPPEAWSSGLLTYRRSSPFQRHWLIEVGHWLLTAERLGFLDQLPISRSRNARGTRDAVNPNDDAHRSLESLLAEVMATHYHTGVGWSFRRWNPPTPPIHDIDVELAAPDGVPVVVQVKAPDQPGRRVNNKIVDGERDDRVVASLEDKVVGMKTKRGARGQLPPDRRGLIVLSPQRVHPMSPRSLIHHLYGTSTWTPGQEQPLLRADARGRFFDDDWSHVAVVEVLNYVASASLADPEDRFRYRSLVLVNPRLEVDTSWFPHSCLFRLNGSELAWDPAPPDRVAAAAGIRVV